VILLAEHDEPTTLAAKKKRQHGASSWPTSTPKNRVWGFENTLSGRPSVEPQISWETATGSVQYTYQIASGRAEWLSRDPLQDAERSQGPNLYDYVQNNPVNAIDPDGLCTCQSGKWTGTGTAKQGGSGIVVLSGISGTFTGTVTCTSDSSLTATVSGTVGGAGSLFLAVGWSQDFGLTASGSDASSLAGYGVFATISAGKSLGGKVGKYLWTNLNLNLVGAAPGQNVTLSGGPQTNTPTPFGAYMFTWRITQSH